MVSKMIFSVLVTLLVAQLVSADKALCPNPDAARKLVYSEDVHEDAPLFGRVATVVKTPAPEGRLSCVTITGLASDKNSGAVSVTSIGFSEQGIDINLVSEIKKGIDANVEIYTK